MRLFIIAGFFLAALTAFNLDAPKYKLIGHRGGVVDSSFTENSLPALQAAVKRGYYMVEIDVRLSKDSQLIAQHDPTFNRYYHVNRSTQQLNWDSIRILKSDRDKSSPLLFEEVLQFCKGKLDIMLDNKITGNDTVSFRRIEGLMKKYDLLKNALIIGTNETRHYFTVVPSINKFHYTNIPFMQGADRDIRQLKLWGVEFYQVDSEFDLWLR